MNRLSWAALLGIGGLEACSLVEGTRQASDAGAFEAPTGAEMSADERSVSGETKPVSTTTAKHSVDGADASVASEGSSSGVTAVSDGPITSESSRRSEALGGSEATGGSRGPTASHSGVNESTGEATTVDTVSEGASDSATASATSDPSRFDSVTTTGETASDSNTGITLPPGTECFDPDEAGACPCFVATDPNDARFAFCFVPRQRAEAKEKCEQVGGGAHLVTILDDARGDWLRPFSRSIGGVYQWWIGLTDEAVEGTFVWDDGSSYDAENAKWNTGEPNNLGNENCVEMVDGRWNDLNCQQPIGYICEL